jgi:hypothetical protein
MRQKYSRPYQDVSDLSLHLIRSFEGNDVATTILAVGLTLVRLLKAGQTADGVLPDPDFERAMTQDVLEWCEMYMAADMTGVN